MNARSVVSTTRVSNSLAAFPDPRVRFTDQCCDSPEVLKSVQRPFDIGDGRSGMSLSTRATAARNTSGNPHGALTHRLVFVLVVIVGSFACLSATQEHRIARYIRQGVADFLKITVHRRNDSVNLISPDLCDTTTSSPKRCTDMAYTTSTFPS